MFPNLYSMWKDAWQSNKLPQEWLLADDFLTWATKNGYKTEYGYKGTFSPENCLAAIPKEENNLVDGNCDEMTHTTQPGAVIEFDKATDADLGNFDAETLMKKMKLPELRQLAADLSIDINCAETKREIAEIIAQNARKSLSGASGDP